MDTFQERERAFEAKFAHDAEMQFKAVARRNRLLGLWAAALMNKSPEESAVYASEVVTADMTHPDDRELINKLVADLVDHANETTIRAQMTVLLLEAKEQILSET
ncbi:hypothetical protein CLV80_10342 [Yoonia maritima]|uniref:DUF1476 domain-containing protein n=1 Tax=Yoonia maritima TaxID=1435347 RepID=A0A2T0W166_9RHOB|nr:DUF1476 domain-containing protein [Yoonia maritima]PRY78719.1 hypothetical protein CLV80_10342 [Yoonia maritima]